MNVIWANSFGFNAFSSGLSFLLPFLDSGAGAVNLAPQASLGSATPTFTRATSATCWGPTGLLLTVGPGVARSTYSELTGALYLGYLCEEARTNNVLQNRDFAQAAWVMTTMTPLKDQVGIDGVANSASSLLATGANALAAQAIVLAAINRPFSIYVKRLIGNGNIDLSQDGVGFTTQAVANDGLYHRVFLVASQLNPILTIRLGTNADKIAVDYVGLEDSAGLARTFPLSPIATTVAAVTRNADILSYPGAGNVNTATGAAYAEVTIASGAGTQQGAVLYSGVGGRPLEKAAGGAPTTMSSFDGTNNPNKAGITDYSLGVPVKIASAWGTALSVTGSGLAVATTAFDGTMGDGTTLTPGMSNASGIQWNGTIRSLRAWQVQKSNAELQAITA